MTIDIARRRLAAQFLVTPARTTPAELVARLGAVQAQDYAGAKWAIGQRIAGATNGLVEQALNDGSIVRTHVLRPTWHFVAPADIRWMLALTGPRIRAQMTYYDRQLGLDEATMRRGTRALAKAMQGGRHLTRPECAAILAKAGVDPSVGQRVGRVLIRAELDALICSGPRRGKQLTYALLDERVPPTAPLERDDALAELTRRYFASRSPATIHDFAWWSGLTVGDARRGVAAAGAALRPETIDDRIYLSIAGARRGRWTPPIARLLPNYDEYFIGFKDRGALQGRVDAGGLDLRGSALTSHVVTVDGRLVGVWRRADDDGPTAEVRLLARLAVAERRAIEVEVRRYRVFHEPQETGLDGSRSRPRRLPARIVSGRPNLERDQTLQISNACRSDASGSRFGTNSCPT